MDENRVMKEFRSVKKFKDIKSRAIAISQLEIRVAVLRVSVKWTRKYKNIQNIKGKKTPKLKNIDNITKLDQCPSQDSIGRLQFRKPLTN